MGKSVSGIPIKGQEKTLSGSDSILKLEGQISSYKREKQILLELSNDITKVRGKADLIRVFSSSLKSYFYFTHSVISLIDKSDQSYYAFLIDKEVLPIRHRQELPTLLNTQFKLTDPFIRQLDGHENLVSFALDDIIHLDRIPGFLRINYECGIKYAMICRLKSQEETIGFVFIYSDKPDGFSDEFKSVIHGIAPHLSNAVANVITNDQIKEKERVNAVLLSLSNDMVTVRSRIDLLNVINFGLKKLINFTHSVMAEIDEINSTYSAFLIDPDSRILHFREHKEVVHNSFPIADGIFDIALKSNVPIIFDMTKFDLTKVPLWFKLNFEAGAKELLIAILPKGQKERRSIVLFSDRHHIFNELAIDIISRISSQLSTAASNIAANEEVLNKESDNSFLLSFSNSIASAKTKNELNLFIYDALKLLGEVRAFYIRVINEDGQTLSPFMYDKQVPYLDKPEFKELLAQKIPVNTGISGKILAQNEPVFIDFQVEIDNGNSGYYIDFWKSLGAEKEKFQKIIGVPLRVGDHNIGIIYIIGEAIKSSILSGICAQISIAVSNIKSYEDILQRDAEKSKLLSLSDEIAALRSREDLLKIVSGKLKTLFSIEEFGIAQINEDGVTYSSFVIDVEQELKSQKNYHEVTSASYKVNDPVFTKIMKSDGPLILDVDKLSQSEGVPDYVHLWKNSGIKYVLGESLRVGGKNIGCAFLHVNSNDQRTFKSDLIRAVCAQLAVAVSNIMSNEKILAYKQMLEVENDHLKEQIKTFYSFSELIGKSPVMQKVYEMITLVANSNSTALILGETGTGKELIARAIHNASPRNDKLMIKVNCAALPSNLIESELFGHERGAFTGAMDRRIGKFELANNSTIFLDEIGEMPIEAQVKLLRVIQERELERLGGKTTIKVNVRIIAATNRNLQMEVNEGKFRSDLFYRLNVFPITIPPLRERKEDLEELSHFFLARFNKNSGKKISTISLKVINEMKAYSWPGNVRELEHLIERSVLLTQGTVLKEIQLPDRKVKDGGTPFDLADRTLVEMERSYIINVLKRCNGKIAGSMGAAEILNVPSTTLHSKIKKLGISKLDYLA